MSLESVFASLTHRYQRVRTGLAVGIADPDYDILRALRGGVWMQVPLTPEFPFEDRQFEVVVMDGSAVSRDSVREAHRVLRPEGCLFFTVQEKSGQDGDGFSAPDIYKIVREGYDIVELKRPPWWVFGRRGRTLTVCARKKNWREHRGLVRDGALALMPFRSRT
ncbi:MAG: class I SAM-dependent methyltransferase [Kiritimatiellae bacterium]|nr:class I SAM-dependent methyltransferase [Kiritimatiellia bacterium]